MTGAANKTNGKDAPQTAKVEGSKWREAGRRTFGDEKARVTKLRCEACGDNMLLSCGSRLQRGPDARRRKDVTWGEIQTRRQKTGIKRLYVPRMASLKWGIPLRVWGARQENRSKGSESRKRNQSAWRAKILGREK